MASPPLATRSLVFPLDEQGIEHWEEIEDEADKIVHELTALSAQQDIEFSDEIQNMICVTVREYLSID